MTDRTIERLPPAPWMDAPELKAVLVALGSPDIDVRFVGGCVRDTVLGLPVTDVDLGTPDLPETVMDKLTAAGLKAIPTGLAHGTITAVSEGRGFEITSLRKDTACDGRHADVEFTTNWVEDASRRDFTFNAMSARHDGTVFDPFGGVADAREGRVRFVGDVRDRIQEDYLRILRYFRFFAHYGRQEPDNSTLSGCHDLRTGLAKLSIERIRDELTKLLTAPDPCNALAAMTGTGILKEILPEAGSSRSLSNLVDLEQNTINASFEFTWHRRFVFILPDDIQDVSALVKRLRFSKKDAKTIAYLWDAAPDACHAFDQPQRNRFFYTYRDGPLGDAVLIAWARNREKSQRNWPDLFNAAATWSPVRFPLRGTDVQSLGIEDGPRIGTLLRQAEEEWIDDGFQATADELLSQLKSLVD